MTLRPSAAAALRQIFKPKSMAIVGASETNLVASGTLRNLLAHGYKGKIYPVNPRHETLQDVRCYPSLTALPEVPETAVITVPAGEVDRVLDECDDLGIGSAVLPSAGYSGNLRDRRIRVLGPEAVGLVNLIDDYVPRAGANHLPHSATKPGPIALVTRSGAIANTVFNRAQSAGVGLAYALNTGREEDLTLWDVVEYLLEDDAVRVVMLALEGIGAVERFAAVGAKASAVCKPVVALELGRSEGGKRAARSHSGALIGSSDVHAAAFREFNIVDVADFDELWQTAALLACWPPRAVPRNERKIGVLAMSGGEGILIADRLGSSGIQLEEPSAQFAKSVALDYPEVHSQNPLDPTTRVLSNPARFEKLVKNWSQSAGFSDVLVALPVYSPKFAASRIPPILAGLTGGPEVNVLVSMWEAHGLSADARRMLVESHIPFLGSSMEAVRAIARHIDHCDRLSTEAAGSALASGKKGFPGQAGSRTGGTVRYSEAIALAEASGLGTPAKIRVEAVDVERVIEKAACLKLPVIVKADVDSALHKAALGLVERCGDRNELLRICTSVLANADRHRIDAAGVLLFEEIPRGCELLLAGKWDAEFGPIVVFGAGGSWAEAARDTAIGFSPLGGANAMRLVKSTRIGAALLERLAGRAHHLLDAICRFSAWHAENATRFATVELNPVVVDDEGRAIALDARVVNDE